MEEKTYLCVATLAHDISNEKKFYLKGESEEEIYKRLDSYMWPYGRWIFSVEEKKEIDPKIPFNIQLY